MQLPLFVTSQSEWRPPALGDLPDWGNATRVGLDTETRDPRLKKLGPRPFDPDAYVVGVSFCIEGDRPYYLPLRHEGGDNCEGDVLGWLREQAAKFRGVLVGANLPYDLEFLTEEDVFFPNVAWFRDVQIADPLIYEMHASYSLAAIADRWGMPGKDETLLACAARDYNVDPKGGLWQLPARFVGPYAEQDAALPLALLREQEKVIEEQNLWEVFDLESRLQPVLLKMRRRGVRVDIEHLERVEKWARQEQELALARVKASTGRVLRPSDIWKAEALAPALERIGVVVGRTPKTGKPKVDKEVLANIDHEVARGIERARKVDKLLQFGDGVREHLAPDGRLHCSYAQLRKQRDDGGGLAGAAYGRLSSSHVNIQQQPARDEFGSFWRAIYLPEEGQQWAACDYSSQEPRLAVHLAALALRDQSSLAARDAYRADPRTDLHQMAADLMGVNRKTAKNIFLGICYGMGVRKLSLQLAIPEHEARALMETFDRRIPYVRRLARAIEEKARRVGYINALGGRRCRFPKDEEGNYDWTYKALNRAVQGGAAYQTKTAMLACDAAGFDMAVQVHDEIGFSVDGAEEAHAAADVMRDCVKLEVPSVVDVEIGESWGHSMGYENGP